MGHMTSCAVRARTVSTSQERGAVMLAQAECGVAHLPLRTGQAVKTDLGLVSIALWLLLLRTAAR